MVKIAKLQMLVSLFEGIRILEDETFNEFYTKISDIHNAMINLGKKVSDGKLIKKILRSLPERFRIKVTTIEESKDLDTMKIKKLVGSLYTYELSLPPLKKNKFIALKAAKEKYNESSDEESADDDGFAMFARILRNMINSSRGKFRNKNVKSSEKPKGDFKGTTQGKNESDKKDPCDLRCHECSGYGHIHVDCGNLKQYKSRSFNVTLSDESDNDEVDETPKKDTNYLALAISCDSPYEFDNCNSLKLELAQGLPFSEPSSNTISWLVMSLSL
jgi:hypothetical protein